MTNVTFATGKIAMFAMTQTNNKTMYTGTPYLFDTRFA